MQATKATKIKVKLDRKVLYELDGGDRVKIKALQGPRRAGAVTVCLPTDDAGVDRSRRERCRARARPAAALRRNRERDLLGRDETPPARSRSSASGRGRSPSRVTTTRCCSSTTSSRRRSRRTRSASTASSSGRPTTAGLVPSSTRATRSGTCGSSSARAVSAGRSRPLAPPWPDELKALGSRRALDVLEAAPARRGRMARRAAAARRPGLRGRGVAGDARLHPARRDTSRARASRSPTSRSTRASTASRGPTRTSAGCSRPCRRDDLRRPRRPRRLEHLVELGRGDARKPWWDARITGAFMSYWIYQHLGNLSPPELAEETMLAARSGRRRRRPAAAGGSRRSGTASRPRAAGRTTATSATRACSCSTRAPRACSPTAAARWSTRRSGTGSSSTRVGAFDHLVIASTLAGLHAARDPPPRSRGTRPSATAAGAARCAA